MTKTHYIALAILWLIIVPIVAVYSLKSGEKFALRLKNIPEKLKEADLLMRLFGGLTLLVGCFLVSDIILQVAWIMVGGGLLGVKKWGYYSFIILSIITAILVGVEFTIIRQSGQNNMTSFIATRILLLVFCGAGIIYLIRPKTREVVFRK